MIEDRHRVRIWDKERGRMHSGDMDNIMLGLGGMLFWQFGYGSPDPISGEERDNYVRMDCTGLKDSEGTLIYEGDILEYWIQPGELARNVVVEWDEQRGFWYVRGRFTNRITDRVTETFSDFFISEYHGESKIIGNRFEHPELLEAGE